MIQEDGDEEGSCWCRDWNEEKRKQMMAPRGRKNKRTRWNIIIFYKINEARILFLFQDYRHPLSRVEDSEAFLSPTRSLMIVFRGRSWHGSPSWSRWWPEIKNNSLNENDDVRIFLWWSYWRNKTWWSSSWEDAEKTLDFAVLTVQTGARKGEQTREQTFMSIRPFIGHQTVCYVWWSQSLLLNSGYHKEDPCSIFHDILLLQSTGWFMMLFQSADIASILIIHTEFLFLLSIFTLCLMMTNDSASFTCHSGNECVSLVSLFGGTDQTVSHQHFLLHPLPRVMNPWHEGTWLFSPLPTSSDEDRIRRLWLLPPGIMVSRGIEGPQRASP